MRKSFVIGDSLETAESITQKVFIIEDDSEMAECIARSITQIKGIGVEIFSNAITATNALNAKIPQLIFLDILLDGPNGLTLLNELNSYSDTAKIPIIIASSLALPERELLSYNVVQILNKETMTPKQIIDAVRDALALEKALARQAPEQDDIDAE